MPLTGRTQALDSAEDRREEERLGAQYRADQEAENALYARELEAIASEWTPDVEGAHGAWREREERRYLLEGPDASERFGEGRGWE